MPVHKSIWNKLVRGLKYAQVVTVGIHERQGTITGHKWGTSGARWLSDAFEKIDKGRSVEVKDWNAFATKFDDLVKQRQLIFDASSKTANISESDLLKAFIRSYFDWTNAGEISFVKYKKGTKGPSGSSIKRVELLQPQTGEWQPVWEDEG